MAQYINVHKHHTENAQENQLSILNLFPEEEPAESSKSLYSIGLHPWHLLKGNIFTSIAMLEQKARDNERIIAIGETGIDKAVNIPLDIQRKAFCHQLRISENLGLPVIVHCVKAADELFRLREGCRCRMPWVYHGYNGSIQMAEELVKRDIYISLGASVINGHEKMKALVNDLDINYMLTETDESDMEIEHLVEAIAKLRGMKVAELTVILRANFKRVFCQ